MEPKKVEEKYRLNIEENYRGWKIWVASDNGCFRWIISKHDKDGRKIDFWKDWRNYSNPKSALIAARRRCIKRETFFAMNRFFLELQKQKKLSQHEYNFLYISLFYWIYEED